MSTQSHMRTDELADSSFNVSDAIDLILGADVAEEIILDGKLSENKGLHFRNSFWLDCFGKTTKSNWNYRQNLALHQQYIRFETILGVGKSSESKKTHI